jgi:hypothetical protein
MAVPVELIKASDEEILANRSVKPQEPKTDFLLIKRFSSVSVEHTQLPDLNADSGAIVSGSETKMEQDNIKTSKKATYRGVMYVHRFGASSPSSIHRLRSDDEIRRYLEQNKTANQGSSIRLRKSGDNISAASYGVHTVKHR